MSTLAERLHEVMDELGFITQVELAKFTGCSKGLVGQWFSGETGLGKKPLLAFQSKTNYSTQWLVDGTGNKFRSGKDIIPTSSSVAKLEDTDYKDTHVEIELFDLNLSAGEGNAVWVVRKNSEPLVFRDNWFKAKHLHPDECKAMYVRGDSMKPILNDWDTVIVNTSDTEIVDGEVYAVIFKNKSYIKVIRNTEDGIDLISYNPDYEPINIISEDADKFQVLGHMVWRGG